MKCSCRVEVVCYGELEFSDLEVVVCVRLIGEAVVEFC